MLYSFPVLLSFAAKSVVFCFNFIFSIFDAISSLFFLGVDVSAHESFYVGRKLLSNSSTNDSAQCTQPSTLLFFSLDSIFCY